MQPGLNAAEVVDRVLREHKLAALARMVTLDAKLAPAVVVGEASKLGTIVDNLVSNAVKFTPDGGTVTVRARLDGESLVLDVADTGPGVPPEERARIFDAFYQGATPQGSLVRGTGIGLSVVQEFVQAHGGTIAIVDGEFPGAHFRVRLPVGGAGGPGARAVPVVPAVGAEAFPGQRMGQGAGAEAGRGRAGNSAGV